MNNPTVTVTALVDGKTPRLKANTSHVILNDEKQAGTYEVWSEHRTEDAALKLCRTLGKNGKQGHTVVVPAAKIKCWLTKSK